ncbi:MAG: hypothetical protein ABI647_11740 [Gemmatimonadota bacterium]
MRVHQIRDDQIVEERHWRSGVEIVSHVNHSHVARIRTVLGLSVSGGRLFDEIRTASQVLAVRSRRRRGMSVIVARSNEPKTENATQQPARRRASSG